jgi:hypothetical protein
VRLGNPGPRSVFQTDAAKTPLPQPVGTAETGLVTGSWGHDAKTTSWKDPMTGMQLAAPLVYGEYYSPPAFPQFVNDDAITLQGLFKWRGEKLDPVKDAKTAPGYFSPTLRVFRPVAVDGRQLQGRLRLVQRRRSEQHDRTQAEEIFEFIPNDPSYLNCLDENGGKKTDGFCPLAWDTRSPRNLFIQQWTPKAFDSGNIKTDPRYKGKYVGFALIGNPALDCKANKYSMYNHNQKNAQGMPWVATLIYQSTADPEGFYLAFEDLPMSPDDWHKSGGMYTNDGDFNDFVFYVPASAAWAAACRATLACKAPARWSHRLRGRRHHRHVPADHQLGRRAVRQRRQRLQRHGRRRRRPVHGRQVCDKGTCVGACGTGEFRCDPGFTCKTGHCIDDACADRCAKPARRAATACA